VSQTIVDQHKDMVPPSIIPQLEQSQKKVVNDLESWMDKAEQFLQKMSTDGVLFTDDEIIELQVS